MLKKTTTTATLNKKKKKKLSPGSEWPDPLVALTVNSRAHFLPFCMVTESKKEISFALECLSF
jgi:hypothetical protein